MQQLISFNSSMASSSLNTTILNLTLIFIFIFSLPPTQQASSSSSCFKSIISFGDSLTDTGNCLRLYSPNKPPKAASLPYGITFFNHPTGRFSDGRLIIDFIAEAYGLPFVPPFYGGSSYDRGVNFAVSGSTALPDSVFAENGISIPNAYVSLAAQLSWFKRDFLPGFCHQPPNCESLLANSLVLLGEIGGNDYNHAFVAGKSVELVNSLVPQVIKSISSAIKELIHLGAVTLMIPGNFPIGCSASYLTLFINSNAQDYDPQTGCFKWLNRLAQYHNKLLQQELNLIRTRNPNISIIYGDYYNAAMDLYLSPQRYGFSGGALTACCGGGGAYNVNFSSMCGEEGSNVCDDPSLYVSWDGLHLTQAAYRFIATGLVRGSYTSPNSLCPFNLDLVGFSDN